MAENKQLIVVATARAKPGMEAELERALRDVIGPTKAQKGCIHFELFRSAEDPASITAYERWSSKEEHDKHLQGDHVKALMKRFEGVVAEPPTFQVLNPL